ncbi:pyridoxal phosphate-dependent transferase [Absidia repens]|uniref:Pyridoxal phosphate-dependent transferase n=1 Tax=Absidia repens TaxID=90262 RepID=A0A1X2IDN6_9FUNG|nr:pyridoxal phosphate-dependent transferase [Absidia repens]
MAENRSQQNKISQRARANLETPVPLRVNLIRALPNLYHPLHNPTGAINMGLAHNDLMQNDLMEKDLEYGDPHGSRMLRGLVAELMNRHFHPVVPLHFRNITVVPGAGAAVWQLIQSLADPGDVALVIGPYYGNFDLDVCVSTGVTLAPIYPHASMEAGVDETLLESDWTKHKTNAKVLLVTNPRNPHGCCYSIQDMIRILMFASKHSLHVIFDEVYGLSTFDSASPFEPFTSVLHLPDIEQYIDPQLVHVVYGMSKDFCMNGLRLASVTLSSMFGYMSTVNDRLAYWFVTTNQQRLSKAYQQTSSYLQQLGLDFLPSGVGPFIVVDIRRLFEEKMTFALENAIGEAALVNGVFVAQGYVFHVLEPGFFRLTYSLEWDSVKKGIDIFDQTIKSFL